MLSFFSACLVLAGSLLLLSSSVYAEETGKLKVTINGDEIKGVLVEISGAELTTPLEKKTPSSGSVVFSDLVPGVYTVTPRRNGYYFKPGFKHITVVAKKTISTKLKAKKMSQKVGMAYCVSCHKNVSSDTYARWLNGPHGNFDYVDASHNHFIYSDFTRIFSYPGAYPLFSGFPNATTIEESLKGSSYSGKTEKYCLGCHGMSSSDNNKVKTFPLVRADGSVDDVNSSSQMSRPVIGCEACHGSGRDHIGRPKKDLTFNDPGAEQCGQCHNKNFPSAHLTYHPAGAAGVNNQGIYEAYMGSAHAKSLDVAGLYTDDKKKEMTALCTKCHSDFGARIYRDKNGDATTLPPLLANEANHTEFAPVQCRTCHDAHNPSTLLKNASSATSTATARSAEFNTCTNCHQLLNSSDGKIAPYHSDHQNSITTNHYDDPATKALEGYNVMRGSDSACTNCHNPHVASVEINEQWAESGHGELSADPWSHYDWKVKTGKDQRLACQQCHTPIGFANIVANQETYNAANNDFSHLTGLQNDNLTCNGCHTTDGSFKRRKIGAYNGYVKFSSGDLAKLDDDSNLCMICHQGRSSKVNVDNEIKTAAGKPMSSTNIHYLAAAATFFGTETRGGYEYAGKTYVTRSTFPGHQGDKNTCVKCHLRTTNVETPDHGFKPLVSDCSGCHTGITSFSEIRPANTPDYDGDGNTTEGLEGEVDSIRAALYAQIKAYALSYVWTRGTPPVQISYPILYDGSANPYWFCDKDNNGKITSSDFCDSNANGNKDDAVGSTPAESSSYSMMDVKLKKATYNYNQAVKEPHGYIHNNKYILQLMIDSIQDLGGNVSMYTRPQ